MDTMDNVNNRVIFIVTQIVVMRRSTIIIVIDLTDHGQYDG